MNATPKPIVYLVVGTLARLLRKSRAAATWFAKGSLSRARSSYTLVDCSARGNVPTGHCHCERRIPGRSTWDQGSVYVYRLRRYSRVAIHASATYRCLRRRRRSDLPPDIIFVPTMLVYHLFGCWAWLINRKRTANRILLFFPNFPIQLRPGDTPEWVPSPTTRLLSALLRWLTSEIRSRQVLIGVETAEMQAVFARLVNLVSHIFPHTVEPISVTQRSSASDIRLACYRPARHEKGPESKTGMAQNGHQGTRRHPSEDGIHLAPPINSWP
jgi:hypothetical protein